MKVKSLRNGSCPSCVLCPPSSCLYLFCLPDPEKLDCNDDSQLHTERNAKMRWEAQLWHTGIKASLFIIISGETKGFFPPLEKNKQFQALRRHQKLPALSWGRRTSGGLAGIKRGAVSMKLAMDGLATGKQRQHFLCHCRSFLGQAPTPPASACARGSAAAPGADRDNLEGSQSRVPPGTDSLPDSSMLTDVGNSTPGSALGAGDGSSSPT
ncbi:hypothetical protein IHE44_0008933 [Lamprotornis superbus]|uniref:Uncharacterized protein n=1 Tax=Lamprotornis superbus TaxID=245042 RepID=A0A835NS07_9PASS|nr:hypothetical protein IHE44_0008933 [Lamprotornis superbus]